MTSSRDRDDVERTGAWDTEKDWWAAPLEDLDDEDTVHIPSNGLTMKAGAAKRALWRPFNIPDDMVAVILWKDGGVPSALPTPKGGPYPADGEPVPEDEREDLGEPETPPDLYTLHEPLDTEDDEPADPDDTEPHPDPEHEPDKDAEEVPVTPPIPEGPAEGADPEDPYENGFNPPDPDDDDDDDDDDDENGGDVS